MKQRIMLSTIVCILLSGCSDLAGAKLLLPEQFGLTQVEENLYIEEGASEASRSALRSAVKDAEAAVQSAYGTITSSPVVNACISEACYEKFGGMGSKAKIYGNYILLSPRGLDWHFLAHEWSHDELRHRLSWVAWYRLPQWFDEGVAVAVSEEPGHSEEHWEYMVNSNIPRPNRTQLMSFNTLRKWLDAVEEFGETQNIERKAKGETEIHPVYTAAGHEVRSWLGEDKTKLLLALIEELNDGESFEQAYSTPSHTDNREVNQ